MQMRFEAVASLLPEADRFMQRRPMAAIVDRRRIVEIEIIGDARES